MLELISYLLAGMPERISTINRYSRVCCPVVIKVSDCVACKKIKLPPNRFQRPPLDTQRPKFAKRTQPPICLLKISLRFSIISGRACDLGILVN